MKRAYEYDRELIDTAIPKILSEEEQTWENAFTADDRLWEAVKLLWGSHVPGSYAPERVLLAGFDTVPRAAPRPVAGGHGNPAR